MNGENCDLKGSYSMFMLKCAISSGEDVHICENPLALSCKHFVCKYCIQNLIDQKHIKCNICNQIVSEKVETVESDDFRSLLDQNLSDCFAFIAHSFKETLKSYNKVIDDNNEKIDLHVEYIKDQIEVCVESLKIQIEELHKSLNDELEDLKSQWKMEWNDLFLETKNNTDLFDERMIVNEIEELNKIIEYQEMLTQEALYQHQNTLRSIRKALDTLNNCEYEGTFQCSDQNKFKITKDFIGRLTYVGRSTVEIDKKILKKIKENKFEDIQLQNYSNPFDLCQTSDGSLLTVNYDSCSLSLYDTDMKLLNEVRMPVQYICAVVSDNDEIYLSDHNNHKIVKMNMGFEKQGEFGNGEGNGSSQLSWPSGLCLYKDWLYVCDCGNERIQKLDRSLEYVATYVLNSEPWYIKAVRNVACVRSRSDVCTRFYNLDDFTLIREYSGHNGIIGASKFCFYEYNRSNKIFYCYNKKGELIEETKEAIDTIDRYSVYEPYYDWSATCIFNSKLVLSIRKCSKLISF